MRREATLVGLLRPNTHDRRTDFKLDDGARVAVLGGGPAGSYFSYFLLDMAQRVGLDIQLDIFEPRDFFTPGPVGCNMCGGIISESLVQALAAEGINLPPNVIQRGLDSYVLHMDVGSVRIETPLQEMRIGSVHRGAGPRDLKKRQKWDSFDGFLQTKAVEKGAHVIQERVSEVKWLDGYPVVGTRSGEKQLYSLLAVTAGINSAALKLFADANLAYKPPEATKTFIREYRLGDEMIERYLGNSMHVFLLDLPGLEFAAAIPKGDYVTVCMLGENMTNETFQNFLNAPEVAACMPPGWTEGEFSCQCAPRMNIHGAVEPFGDRIVFIGDSGVTRLYKDGIGGAYRTSKAAASTAVFQGVSALDFRAHYWPACKTLETDNSYGRVIFRVTDEIKKRRFARRAVMHMTADEQGKVASARRMSMILWDMFTGSAPYRDIFMRTLQPAYLSRFFLELAAALSPFKGRTERWAEQSEQLSTGDAA